MQLPAPDSALGQHELAALTAELVQRNWLPTAARITGISSPGAGNMNQVLRVHLQGAPTASLILKQSLPVVAKYPNIPAPVARDLSEAAFYQAVAGSHKLAARMPALLGHDIDHHLLCFEDLGTGTDFTSLYQRPSDQPGAATQTLQDELMPLFAWLGELHLQPVPEGFPHNADMRVLNHEHIFVLPFVAGNGLAEFPEVAAWQEQFCTQTHSNARIQALGELYLARNDRNASALNNRAAPALLHGDFYPGSWVHRPGCVASVIDPEFGFVGPPEFDLGVLLAHLTFSQVDPAQQHSLLQHYPQPTNFSLPLAQEFAAVEILRRLLGVAKLPLNASAPQQLQWLNAAAATLAA